MADSPGRGSEVSQELEGFNPSSENDKRFRRSSGCSPVVILRFRGPAERKNKRFMISIPFEKIFTKILGKLFTRGGKCAIMDLRRIT